MVTKVTTSHLFIWENDLNTVVCACCASAGASPHRGRVLALGELALVRVTQQRHVAQHRFFPDRKSVV